MRFALYVIVHLLCDDPSWCRNNNLSVWLDISFSKYARRVFNIHSLYCHDIYLTFAYIRPVSVEIFEEEPKIWFETWKILSRPHMFLMFTSTSCPTFLLKLHGFLPFSWIRKAEVGRRCNRYFWTTRWSQSFPCALWNGFKGFSVFSELLLADLIIKILRLVIMKAIVDFQMFLEFDIIVTIWKKFALYVRFNILNFNLYQWPISWFF